MSSRRVSTRRRRLHTQHSRGRERSSTRETDAFELDTISSTKSSRTATIVLPTIEQEQQALEESPLVQIIKTKKRKDWAKLVVAVDERDSKETKESLLAKMTKLVAKIPSPFHFLLDSIEHRKGFTIRSYFEFILWLFTLNIFTFILCFLCIIMPTYIYPNTVDFSTYAMGRYPQPNASSFFENTSDVCTLTDPRCKVLNKPLMQDENDTCLDNPLTASSCCSLHTDAFFINSSRDSETDWKEFVSDLIDGTGVLSLNQLFIGYYRNLTRPTGDGSYVQTYNMALAVLLTTLACLLFTGIVIVRKFGEEMKRSYVQTESFENNLFQYMFARWDYRSVNARVARRHENRFRTEIRNIFFERRDKINYHFVRARDELVFKLQRVCVWLGTILIFVGAATILYFTNRFAFQERAKRELNEGAPQSSRIRDLAIDFLPSVAISVINLASQLIFAFIRDFKLYTRTTAVRHYLLRVIMMRLLLLFTFVFIVILQITCNSNHCGRQSELISCVDIKGQATFIHCWETLIGQVIYRLVITDTAVMILVHLIVDPLRILLRRCYLGRKKKGEDDASVTDQASEKTCFLFLPLEFEVGDYVLDLTYTQTLCWHGVLFCPFLPLIAAVKNIVIFAVKWLSLVLFRTRSPLELSPARARFMFTGVLLFSFVWALLPIAFLTTSLRPSRGCGPFRVYSHEPDFYIYYTLRNLFAQAQNRILVQALFKLTSAVVIVPTVLILILLSCILMIRRNSYRAASVELYKLLYTSRTGQGTTEQSSAVVSVAM